ncbi:MAG: hypothetical protein PHI29_13165 [Gallionella sp.]|nr:hypothetical protein [Gallionella sp.]
MIDRLKATFPTEQTERGACLVIPGTQWEPDWEAQLPQRNEVFYEQGKVLIKVQDKPISSKNDDNSSSQNDEVKRRPGRCGGRRATGNWKPEDEKRLIEEMQRREIVALPMMHRAQIILQDKLELFPGRTAVGLTQHYKQITTPAQRAVALAESLKPPAPKVRWENTASRQEKYSLDTDGLHCLALAVFDKGALQKISAIVTPKTPSNTPTAAIAVNDVPIEVIKLLNALIDQLQEPPQQ